jgi:hypothetical protein
MYNAYMLTSKTMQRIYMFWVKRWQETLALDHWTPEYSQACDQLGRLQTMYDSLEDGKIVYWWHWHKIALDEYRRNNK